MCNENNRDSSSFVDLLSILASTPVLAANATEEEAFETRSSQSKTKSQNDEWQLI
jgi:hypothetical protein